MSFKLNRAAFTLLELLVVVAVVALLATLAIPKISDTLERSRAATQAFSTADVARQVESFAALNRRYPDGWDTLIQGTADAPVRLARLAPELTGTTILQATLETLTADQVTSLSLAGISHAFIHDTTSGASYSGVTRTHFGTGTGHDGTPNLSSVVVINRTVGSDGMNLLVNDFGLNPNRAYPDPHATYPYPRILGNATDAGNIYVVLGLGPRTTIVQSQLQEAPIMEHRTSATNYSRALAVFEVPLAGTKRARLVGILGPDGRSKRVSIDHFNSMSVPH